eukprot:scaffold138838_cov45-Phaeocystis_antarctica.AAC.1
MPTTLYPKRDSVEGENQAQLLTLPLPLHPHHSPLTTHLAPLTTHHSPLTTQSSPSPASPLPDH